MRRTLNGIGRRAAVGVGAVLTAALGCRGYVMPPLDASAFPFAVDTLRSEVIQPGVVHRFIYSSRGPWAMHVFDIDRTRCWSGAALKSEGGAIGRERTSVLARQLATREQVAGAVNADFFLFTPPGVPVGAYISRGRVIAGPIEQAVIAFDSSGAPRIETLRVTGRASFDGREFPIAGWNRDVRGGLALFDDAWGMTTDTASSVVEILLEGPAPFRVVTVDTLPTGAPIPRGGVVLKAGRDAPAATRAALVALRPGGIVRADVAITPFHPREAVGGRPVLVRDSAVLRSVDSVGGAGFATARHPRTGVGIANAGRRLLIVVVDGRQAPYSDGMTLRELADLFRALGARDAINLDGGGSTTFVHAVPDSAGVFRVANRPSDPAGERPVGDALAIVKRCGG